MARAAKEEAEAHKDRQRDALKAAVMEAQEDGFPVDVEEKEAYFMSEVARGEQLAQEGMFQEHIPRLAIAKRMKEMRIRPLIAEANISTRLRQRRGRPLLLQSLEGLPTAFRPDHHLRQDRSKGKAPAPLKKASTNTLNSLSWMSSQR